MEIVKDLILTDCFLIKCLIDTGGMRLSDYLDNLNRSFVPMRNVTMIDLDKDIKMTEIVVVRGNAEQLIGENLTVPVHQRLPEIPDRQTQEGFRKRPNYLNKQ